MTANQLAYFNAGSDQFQETQSVSTPGSVGLGPRFNSTSCGSCHSQPAIGGTSPAVNPQFAAAADFGGTNVIPSFITLNGPIREARFKSDGGVHALFTIIGRSDAPGCNIQQPDFNFQASHNNLSFRIPTPVFGAGLIESIQDSTIIANMNADKEAKERKGIHGHPNRNGNDGTITRFGWKAQNKSLLLFAGEAYNVEMGVTNEIFNTERDETNGCLFNGTPEDNVVYDATTGLDAASDVTLFTQFMRFLAPPTQKPLTPTSERGQRIFMAVGCAMCHTPQLQTGPSSIAALSHQPVNLYSDLLVHNMGEGLEDGITQGLAGHHDFRTAPLWGLGQRLFLLHDGRTTDLLRAIQDHKSNGSEANKVIEEFDGFDQNDKNALFEFLRSL